MKTVTVNVEVLRALGYRPNSVVLSDTWDGRTLAAFDVTPAEADRLEAGITRLRTEGGCDRYALDAAMYAVQDAKHDMMKEERA